MITSRNLNLSLVLLMGAVSQLSNGQKLQKADYMRSKAIDEAMMFLEIDQEVIELYSELHATGCFECSTSDQQLGDKKVVIDEYAMKTDECIDLCSPLQADQAAPLKTEEWKAFFSPTNEDKIDSGCGHVILNLMSDLVRSDSIHSSDIIRFANSLVYDERVDICYAFDPRDGYRRRLDILELEDCGTFDCFNCAYTAGICAWDANFSECGILRKSSDDEEVRRWWTWYEHCEDKLGLCFSNANTISSMAGGSLIQALDSGSLAHFAMLDTTIDDGFLTIPRNYFCQWQIEVDIDSLYYLSIMRNHYPLKETMELKIIGETKSEHINDLELASADPNSLWERYILMEAQGLEIYARNKYETNEPTFQISLEKVREASGLMLLQHIVTIMCVLFICPFCCLMICNTMIRRCRAPQERIHHSDDEDAAQNRFGLGENAPYRRAQEQEALRKQMHKSVIEQYQKLIPVIKYKKDDSDIDEFGQADCVICMETFANDVKVRKLPTCRHLFHDDCIMKWLSAKNQEESQRCPMCNEDITVELLEKAIQEDSKNSKRRQSRTRNSASQLTSDITQLNSVAPMLELSNFPPR